MTTNNNQTLDTRALQRGTIPGAYTVPDTLSAQIIEIAKQGAYVSSLATIVQGKGKTSHLVDLGNTPADIVAEMATVTAGPDPSIKEIEFLQKRFATAVEVSKNVSELTAVDLEAYLGGLFANRSLLGMEKQMFNTGDAAGNTGLQNIVLYNSLVAGQKIDDIPVKTAVSASVITYQELVSTYVEFAKKPQYIQGSIWVVEDVTKLSTIKDDSGKLVMTFDNLPNGAVGRVLGLPVYKTEAFTAGQKVAAVLINPAKAYQFVLGNGSDGVSSAPEISDKVKHIAGDTTQGLKGSQVFLGETYCAGKVINPYAITILKTA